MGMTDKIFPFAFGLVLYYEVTECGPPLKDWLGEDNLSAKHLNPSRINKMMLNHEVVVELEEIFSRR